MPSRSTAALTILAASVNITMTLGCDQGNDLDQLELVAQFDPQLGQLPEGLALRGEDAFVSFAFLGEVHRVPEDGGPPELYAKVPGLPADNAFVTGLGFDDEGGLLIAQPSFAAEPVAGIYRAAPGGGTAELFATHDAMIFPSAVQEHPSGDLFATDSATATIFRITPLGETSVWLTDARLAGNRAFCGHEGDAFDVGANGLAVTESTLYVAVSDQASILAIPILEDGSAGEITVLAGPDCEALGGIDGITLDDDAIYVALNRQNRIARVGLDGTIETLIEDDLLDFPSTVRVSNVNGRRTLFVSNFAFVSDDPAPSLARLRLR